jgi:hypothetical protein
MRRQNGRLFGRATAIEDWQLDSHKRTEIERSDLGASSDGRLHALFEAWTREVLTWLSDPSVQPRVTLEFAFTGLNDTREEPHRSYMVSQVAEEILERPSTKATIGYLMELSSVQEILRTEPPGRLSSPQEATFTTLLLPFLETYLERTADATFQDDVFGELYSDLEELLFELQAITVVGLVEFENLALEYAPFDLEVGVTI